VRASSQTVKLVSFSFSTRVPNRGSPPAVLLRESYREGGQVKNRTVANLSSWPEAKVEALSRALTGPAGSRQQDLVAAMIIAAVIDGSSKLATARGLRADRGQFVRRGAGPAGLRR